MYKLIALTVLALATCHPGQSHVWPTEQVHDLPSGRQRESWSPSFKDISAKYKGQKTAEAMLWRTASSGFSERQMGRHSMPAQKVSPADAKDPVEVDPDAVSRGLGTEHRLQRGQPVAAAAWS